MKASPGGRKMGKRPLLVVATPPPFLYYRAPMAFSLLQTGKVWRYLWLLVVLLTAAGLRLYDLPDAPPGLTHDEADHGITAWSIVNGARDIYFTIGYGREPLYDYSTAILMHVLGPTYLAARLTAVFFGLLLIAGLYVWVRAAFDCSTALLAATGLAVSFWAVMTSRQALRSITLPTLFVFAVYFFWQAAMIRWRNLGDERGLSLFHPRFFLGQERALTFFLISGFFLGASMYTYIPARILWFVFPCLLGYLLLMNLPLLRLVWPGTGLMLLLAAAMSLPLFSYLFAHPMVEVRIEELSAPLKAAADGNFAPLLANAKASLRLFTVEGDTAWRYNIPGRPFFAPFMGVLFYAGIAIAVWQTVWPLFRDVNRDEMRRAVACFLSLVWLVAGLLPSLVTGPALSTTQSIGMQPVLYLFPALTLTAVGKIVTGNRRLKRIHFSYLVPLLLFSITAIFTARDYFGIWANNPEVRVQYESALVTALRYLNHSTANDVAIATITPGRFHSPAVAEMVLRNPSVNVHWFDGRSSLLLPQTETSIAIIPGFASLPDALTLYFEPATLVTSLPLPPTDKDRPLKVYQVDGTALLADMLPRFSQVTAGPANVGDVLEFLGYDLQTPGIVPGRIMRLATLWRIKQPLEDALLFTHIQGADGRPVAQADRLGVPGDSWQSGDVFIQLHEILLPSEMTEGDYSLVVGLCRQVGKECPRLPVTIGGAPAGDLLYLQPLTVVP